MATVADPTDPNTQCLNETPAKQTNNYSEPTSWPKHGPKINFPCKAGNALEFFKLFFSDEILQTVADNTNNNAHLAGPPKPKRDKDTDLNGTLACK